LSQKKQQQQIILLPTSSSLWGSQPLPSKPGDPSSKFKTDSCTSEQLAVAVSLEREASLTGTK